MSKRIETTGTGRRRRFGRRVRAKWKKRSREGKGFIMYSTCNGTQFRILSRVSKKARRCDG